MLKQESQSRYFILEFGWHSRIYAQANSASTSSAQNYCAILKKMNKLERNGGTDFSEMRPSTLLCAFARTKQSVLLTSKFSAVIADQRNVRR